MTTIQCNQRDSRMIGNIESVLRVNRLLAQYAAAVQITIEDATIVLRGELPSSDHKAELVPAIRQAGVLDRVSDHVRVAGSMLRSGNERARRS